MSMKHFSGFLTVLALTILGALPARADWTVLKNLDFRCDVLYVTDPANSVAVVPTPCGPSVIGPASGTPATVDGDSFTYGYLSGVGIDGSRDRDNAVDPRVAGIHFKINDGTQIEFEVNGISPGNYNLFMAIGDAAGAHSGQRVEVFDNTTSRLTLTGLSTDVGQFYDAGGNLRTSPADWAANQVPTTVNISTGLMKFRFGALTNVGSNTVWAYIGFQKQAAGGGVRVNPISGRGGAAARPVATH